MKPENYPQQPSHLWEHFYQITQIPRPSKEEQAVRAYVIDAAERLGHTWQMDSVGNLVVYVAATEGMSDRETVTIQNHLDMVTVKTEDAEHDFSRDPLSLRVADGWLLADRTTLGADNGVGCAAALAVMTDPDVVHPPLELLFTVDEETGLGGALSLDSSMLFGTRMLNLDTEESNELYIGCAGGGGWEFERRWDGVPTPVGHEVWQVCLRGLAGGHSGIQIHEQLGNAIKLLGQFLANVDDVQLVSLDVGVAHNVIPREGSAIFSCPTGARETLLDSLKLLREKALSYLPSDDAALEFELLLSQSEQVISPGATQTVVDLLAVLPHGAQSYSPEQPADLVAVSINLAVVKLTGGKLYLESRYRFF
ncbi:MAG: dipeptidase D, partial [Halioglobus sp.]